MTGLFEPADLPEVVTIKQQIAEVQREIALRETHYPRWIASGRLKQDVADRNLRRMRAVLLTLEAWDGVIVPRGGHDLL